MILYFQAWLILRRVIKLGTRLGLSDRKLKDMQSSTSTEDATSTFDWVLKLNVIIMGLCSVSTFVFFFILGIAINPGARYTVQAGLGSSSLFLTILVISTVWQYERCIRKVFQASYFDVSKDPQISLALKRMRQQQISILILAAPEAVIHFLNALYVIPPTWIWVLFHGSIDILFLFSFGILTRLMKYRSSTWKTKNSINNLPAELSSAPPTSTMM